MDGKSRFGLLQNKKRDVSRGREKGFIALEGDSHFLIIRSRARIDLRAQGFFKNKQNNQTKPFYSHQVLFPQSRTRLGARFFHSRQPALKLGPNLDRSAG